jgi:2'-5' RNA ligase
VAVVLLPARGRPPQAAARRAGLELVRKVVTNWRHDLMMRESSCSSANRLQLGAMAHALEVLFDASTEAVIKDLWARLESAAVPSLASRTHRRHRPHVSLAVADRIEPKLEGLGERLAATYLDITLYSPAVFPRAGVLYLSVVPTLALLRLHQEVHTTLGDGIVGPRDGYSVGAWVPHCTLGQDLTRAQLVRGIELLYDQPVITAHTSSLGVLDTATGEVLPLVALGSQQ